MSPDAGPTASGSNYEHIPCHNDMTLPPNKMATNSAPGSGREDATAQMQRGGGTRRARVKRFIKEKGSRIAGAAATIGMLVFNVVSSCC